MQKKILDVFERNPHISNVEFSDMALTSVALLSLFRTLQCHDHLVRLALPGNRIGEKNKLILFILNSSISSKLFLLEVQ